jgi:AsmA family protein
MKGPLFVRRGLVWTAAALAVALLAAAALDAAVGAGYFRGPLIGFFEARYGRRIEVKGTLEAHIFSFNPRLIAEHITIGNPLWMPPGITAEIGKLTLVIEIPRLGRPFAIQRLEMAGAAFHLLRDATGEANWQRTDPSKGLGSGLPLIRSLSIPAAHVTLEDARRQLTFEGSVSARGQAMQPLRIEGAGQLNGRAATFEINGDPLATATYAHPYPFTFSARSSGSGIDGHGVLPQPFDFNLLDGSFDGTGEDLKDLYFLTGVTLVNTGSYRLSGKFALRGYRTKFSELVAAFGQSEIRGDLEVDSSSKRSQLKADLDSDLLRMSDLGAAAAGHTSEPGSGPPLLLSDAALNPRAMRRSDGVVNFRARRMEVGRVSLHAVAGTLRIDHGVLAVSALSADVLGGRLTGDLKLDANEDVPAADVNLKLNGLQLAQIDHQTKSAQPPVEGAVQARLAITGEGSSLHQVAATANGMLTAVLPHGAVRTSLAELAGTDLRGLLLLLTKSAEQTGIRCAVASFKANHGTLVAQRLVVDTDPVLISGGGQINLESEALDLTLQGQPKSLRFLRLRSPILIRGTLLHPSIEIPAQHAPLALLSQGLALVSQGLAKDADCPALLAAAAPPSATP